MSTMRRLRAALARRTDMASGVMWDTYAGEWVELVPPASLTKRQLVRALDSSSAYEIVRDYDGRLSVVHYDTLRDWLDAPREGAEPES